MTAHGCCRAAQFYFPEGEDEAGLIDFQLMAIGDIGGDVACESDEFDSVMCLRVCSSQLNLPCLQTRWALPRGPSYGSLSPAGSATQEAQSECWMRGILASTAPNWRSPI